MLIIWTYKNLWGPVGVLGSDVEAAALEGSVDIGEGRLAGNTRSFASNDLEELSPSCFLVPRSSGLAPGLPLDPLELFPPS